MAPLIGCLIFRLSALAAFDPAVADFDALLLHATRYGNTPEKRAQKEAAREELFARGGDSLRGLMQQVHLENIEIHSLADQLVVKLEAEESAAVLVEFLDSEHERTRRLAAYFLGYHVTPGYAEALLPLLDDPKTQGAAMRTLGKWRVVSAVPPILPFLRNEDERKRVIAANALRDIGDASALPALVAAMDDPVFTVRNAALRAVVSFGDAAVSPLRNLAQTAHGRALRQAIRGLGQVGGAPEAKLLLGWSHHDDPEVRRDAERAIDQIQVRLSS